MLKSNAKSKYKRSLSRESGCMIQALNKTEETCVMTKAGRSAKRLLLAKCRFSALVVVWTLVVCAFTFVPGTTLFAEEALEKVRIGVLSKNGIENCLKQWGATADYLTAKIPEYAFSIDPLGFDEISPAIERGDVNFILANPAQ